MSKITVDDIEWQINESDRRVNGLVDSLPAEVAERGEVGGMDLRHYGFDMTDQDGPRGIRTYMREWGRQTIEDMSHWPVPLETTQDVCDYIAACLGHALTVGIELGRRFPA